MNEVETASRARLRSYLIHYGEVGLKKRNRPFFERRLIRNIYYATRGLEVEAVRRLYGRLRLEQRREGDEAELERRLGRVFGIAHFDPVEVLDGGIEEIRAAVAGAARAGGFETFAVRARRVNKEYPRTSQELNRELGALIEEVSGARVDLDHPERTFELLVLNQDVYFFHRRIPGPGGLPVGVGGRIGVLLSGGIDSPVAALRLMKRGCHPVFIHFHSAPFTDARSQEKVVALAHHVARHRVATELYLVPLGELQRRIVAGAPSSQRVILYRRYMLRIAERIARRRRCLALATGESLGQVSSQTLENQAVLDRTVHLPILRPLIAMDKQEIIDEAKAAKTFEISIQPHDDCCSFLMPPDPTTRASLNEVRAIEDSLALADEEERAVEGAERILVE